MLDFRVHTFLTVCKHLNFTRAAEELNITQPAVSQHIRYLEDYYEIKLFDYKNRKISLTEAGRFLKDVATTMLHDDIHLQGRLKELQGRKGSLAFGVTLTVGEFVMTNPLLRFFRSFPEMNIEMTVANTQELLKKLDSGELDFALVEGFFAKNQYDSLVYSEERYVAVRAADDEASVKMTRIEDTFSQRLIIREAGSGTREIFERYLESRNFQIHDYETIAEISNISVIKSLVEAGCGITFLYEQAVRTELETGRLARIPLADFPLTHDFTFIWRRNSIFSDYYHNLFQLIRE